MEIVDELVPLEKKDVEYLQAKKQRSEFGCGVVCFVLAGLCSVAAYSYFGSSYLLLIIPGILALVFLLIGLMMLVKTDDRNIVRDLQEGRKRRIVAPIEQKDIIDKTRTAITMRRQVVQSTRGPRLKYFMTAGGFRFNLTEEEYLTGAGKGDFVEFYVAPHSNLILSKPIEVREE
jgi:hypothetical protein